MKLLNLRKCKILLKYKIYFMVLKALEGLQICTRYKILYSIVIQYTSKIFK